MQNELNDLLTKAKELLNWEPKYSDVDTLVSSTWNVYKDFVK